MIVLTSSEDGFYELPVNSLELKLIPRLNDRPLISLIASTPEDSGFRLAIQGPMIELFPYILLAADDLARIAAIGMLDEAYPFEVDPINQQFYYLQQQGYSSGIEFAYQVWPKQLPMQEIFMDADGATKAKFRFKSNSITCDRPNIKLQGDGLSDLLLQGLYSTLDL